MELKTGYYLSPIGWLEIKADDTSLVSLKFIDEKPIPDKKLRKSKLINNIIKQLREYFKGKRILFDFPIHLEGTEFQLKVWKEIQAVPFGKTTTYLKIAIQLGSSKNVRAVGSANGKNPIPIIVPCHRVIGENKELIGYAGGLWRKKWLLEHESNEKQLNLDF
jgi:methylated-DNA-[protein]-cysteine S-methyltransferase